MKKTIEKLSDIAYIYHAKEKRYKPVKAKILFNFWEGNHFFVHESIEENNSGYIVSEINTGAKLFKEGQLTIDEAKIHAMAILIDHKDNFRRAVQSNLERIYWQQVNHNKIIFQEYQRCQKEINDPIRHHPENKVITWDDILDELLQWK